MSRAAVLPGDEWCSQARRTVLPKNKVPYGISFATFDDRIGAARRTALCCPRTKYGISFATFDDRIGAARRTGLPKNKLAH